MNHRATNRLTEYLRAELAAVESAIENDSDYWEQLACGQDTEEAEASGTLAGYADGIRAALAALSAARDDRPMPATTKHYHHPESI